MCVDGSCPLEFSCWDKDGIRKQRPRPLWFLRLSCGKASHGTLWLRALSAALTWLFREVLSG